MTHRSLDLLDRFEDIVASVPIDRDVGDVLGYSRAGSPVRGFRIGTGRLAISLLAGCHADEPVGPRLLRHFVSYLQSCDRTDPIVESCDWWIVPHINPDGEQRNAVWQDPDAASYDLIRYLTSVVRELPGDDIEFGFPRDDDDVDARPENKAVHSWWRSGANPFALHCSLHGMGFAAGPWFLIDRAWRARVDALNKACVERVDQLGYTLHDVERLGEKGFARLGRGFCTRPDSRYMIEHFKKLGDPATARLFRPSSMETIGNFGGEPLTLVSEMPLFITPGVGETLGPPDPIGEQWKARIARWRLDVQDGAHAGVIAEAKTTGLHPMNVRDQMDLQWTFVQAGVESVVRE